MDKTPGVLDKVSRHEIDEDTEASLMQLINEILQIVWFAQTGVRGVKSGHLVSPRPFERVVSQRKEFHMSKIHLLAVVN